MNDNFIFINYRLGEFEKYYKRGLKEVIKDNKKQYCYLGSYWTQIDPYKEYEGYLLLMKTPMPSFNGIWEMFINPKNDDEKVGSISVIVNYYRSEFKSKLKELSNNQKLDLRDIKRLRIFRREVMTQMDEIINSLKNYGGCYWFEINELLNKIIH